MKSKQVIKAIVIMTVLIVVGIGAKTLYEKDDAGPEKPVTDVARKVNVTLAQTKTMRFEDVLIVQGNVQAKRFAMVSPRINGVLEEVFVDKGDTVEAGKTKLFQTDSVKLTESVEISKRDVEVAQRSLEEKQASMERYRAEHDNAKFEWERYQNLDSKGVAASDEMVRAKSNFRSASAMLKYSAALIELSKAQYERAKSLLVIAEKNFNDSLIVSPMTGRVCKRYQEPGEMGEVGSPVIRIEDASLVEVSVFVPSEAYGKVVEGATPMQVMVNGADLGAFTVSYKSPTIDYTLRTFEIQCVIANPPAVVAPGAMADVKLILAEHEGLGVPTRALQDRTKGKVVFVKNSDKAKMVPVETGFTTAGWTEVKADGLKQDDDVVVVGGYFLNDGDALEVVQESN